METEVKSKRLEMAERILSAARKLDLCQVYAGFIYPPSEGRNYYQVPLCRARTIDASVHVYGRTCITLRVLGNGYDKQTYRSVEDVVATMQRRFGNG
jgi:type II secretory pathway component PulM